MRLKKVKGKAEICLLLVVLRVFIDYNINNADDVWRRKELKIIKNRKTYDLSS